MTLFSPRYMSVSGELKSSRSRAANKRTNPGSYGPDADLEYDNSHEDYYDRVYDTQRVPASSSPVPLRTSPAKRMRSSCPSTKHRHSRDRSHTQCSKSHSSSSAKLGLEELQIIKKELVLIKTQIDGLLESLERMDTHRAEQRESPEREVSPSGSQFSPLLSSPDLSCSSLSPPCRHRMHRDVARVDTDNHHTMIHHHSEEEI